MDAFGDSDHRLPYATFREDAVRERAPATRWVYSHPYAAALGAAGLLVVAGVGIVVMKSSGTPTISQIRAWGGTGTILNLSYGPDYAGSQKTPTIMQQTQNGAPYAYTLPAPQTNPDAENTNSAEFDFDAFVSMLSQESAPKKVASSGNASSTDAYAFIPGGFISTATQAAARTKLQQALYDYGNNVGSSIQSFEQARPNESQVVMDHVQDRGDPGKAGGVQALGRALSGLGDTLLATDGVPLQVKAAHEALAKSYQDIGQKLQSVPQARSDADFLAAVRSYNASADVFTQNYVALASLFVAYGVTFSQNDAGSVFIFAPTGL